MPQKCFVSFDLERAAGEIISTKGVHDIQGTMWHTQPNHHINTNESCFGHGCVTWFDDNHEKHNYMICNN